MPEFRIPVDPVCTLSDNDCSSVDENYKLDIVSERSNSPKSDSVVSDLSDAAEIFDNVSEGSTSNPDTLAEEMDNLKMSEELAEELTKQGADMRHVLCTSWKLQSKYSGGKISKSSSLLRGPPGQALRDMAHAQKMSIEEHEIAARMYSGYSVRPPPGFENVQNLASYEEEPSPILVSYADGSNTFTLSNKPLCMHNITVACAVDSCHVFLQQRKNPTFDGLQPLEQAMHEAFLDEPAPALLRPIATGSLLAVHSDEKWYRCQVVSYDEVKDCCDVKFVDHGGYTTVNVSDLRPLNADLVRLPFQAIEVYVAHISPADDEIVIDIASDILFRDDVSIQLVGRAEDGIPVVQAYFYNGDYINLFTQEILDDAKRVFLEAFPEYVPSPTSLCLQSESEITNEISKDSAEPSQTEGYSTDEGVWSPEPTEELSTTSSTSSECLSPVPTETSLISVDPAWLPVVSAQPVLAYCVPDPNTGMMMYVAAPVVYVPAVQQVAEEVYVDAEQQQYLPAEEQLLAVHDQSEHTTDFDKPYEEWSQEDYERYYNI